MRDAKKTSQSHIFHRAIIIVKNKCIIDTMLYRRDSWNCFWIAHNDDDDAIDASFFPIIKFYFLPCDEFLLKSSLVHFDAHELVQLDAQTMILQWFVTVAEVQ